MERKSIIILATLATLFGSFFIEAKTKKYNDKDKYNQIRSMENGTWNFSPGNYYVLRQALEKYGGATGGHGWLGLNIECNEKDSKWQRVSVPRGQEAAWQTVISGQVSQQLDSIQPIVVEETLRSAERNAPDVTYQEYKKEFNELQDRISTFLTYCLVQSKGELAECVSKLQDDNDVICAEIEYIHQAGPNHEIEVTKREIAYDECREEMVKVAAACASLAKYAMYNYKP